MQRIRFVLWCFVVIGLQTSFAQSKAGDIAVSKLPAEVKQVLEEYVNILTSSKDLDECAQRFTSIAGGGLINEDPVNVTLRQTVQPFSLKKDFNNIKFYAQPVKVTRVNVSKTGGSGYGASAVAGTIYKIWIDKKDPKQGMPAPVSIVVPENHSTIKTPKVMNIGSF
ncbi:hypothetical protein AD998_09395 [bacterium 336/3]|nr:hypothetical protein AD998_09395 [bacterium 336/3]